MFFNLAARTNAHADPPLRYASPVTVLLSKKQKQKPKNQTKAKQTKKQKTPTNCCDRLFVGWFVCFDFWGLVLFWFGLGFVFCLFLVGGGGGGVLVI